VGIKRETASSTHARSPSASVPRMGAGRLMRLAPAFALAALVGGCFQPMYGQLSPTAGPGVGNALTSVSVTNIEAPKGTTEERLAVELRNELLFGLTGGAGSNSPTHELTVKLSSQSAKIIVDITTARPELENFGLDASYRLTEMATGKTVVTGTTFARVSYDVPGQVQRFARLRGLRDAETRAAKVIADNIKTRLASYFVAGT
jgi:LPS-assembly lipoprotein